MADFPSVLHGRADRSKYGIDPLVRALLGHEAGVGHGERVAPAIGRAVSGPLDRSTPTAGHMGGDHAGSGGGVPLVRHEDAARVRSDAAPESRGEVVASSHALRDGRKNSSGFR